MRGSAATAAWLILMASSVSADEVHLRSGGRLSGIIVQRTATSVEVEVGAGRVTVPLTLVERIETGDSALARHQSRARSLSPTDAAGWLGLAETAHASGLSSQARSAYQRVLEIDPGNAAAHRALGHQLVGEQWLSRDEAMQARGYVLFEGEWVAPAQRDSVLAERDASRRDRLEAERAQIAVAEAEARAREAEARARVAEAEAARAEEQHDGFVVGPWGIGLGPTFVVGQPVVSPRCCNVFHAPGHCLRQHGTTIGTSIGLTFGHRGSRSRSHIRSHRAPAPTPSPAPARERAVVRGVDPRTH